MSLAHALVAPAVGLALLLAMGAVLFALADRAGKRDAAEIRARLVHRERGRASWEARSP